MRYNLLYHKFKASHGRLFRCCFSFRSAIEFASRVCGMRAIVYNTSTLKDGVACIIENIFE